MQTSGRIRANFRDPRLFGLGKTRQKSSLLAPCDWSRECSTIFYRLNGLSRVNATEWRWNTPRAEPHGAARRVLGPPPSAKSAHATDPHGLRGEVPSAGVGARPVARGRTRGMAVEVGDWRTKPAQTLGKPPNLAPHGAELRIQGPPPSAYNPPRAEAGGEPRVKLSAAAVAGRPVARGRADV